jgi:hypothetical protein
MPRHRKAHGRVPWALHRGESSWRSVLPGGVLPGILAPARGARRAARRAPGPGDAQAAARGPVRERLRLARSLMVTPWFAASAGIVIAALLAVDSPAGLMYVPNGPAVRCRASGCVGSASNSPGVTTDVPSVKLTAPRAGQTGVPVRRHAVYQLGYRVVRRWPGGFVAVITLPADLKPGAWRLRFGFSSARVDHVWGARWQPSRHGHAGTATGSWRPHGYDPHDRGLDGRQLMILVAGTPTVPSGGRLDGVSCEFSG